MSRTLFAGGEVFDGVSDTLASLDVLVVDGVIEEVDESLPRRLGDGGEVVELRGRTLMPGLIDAHVHAYLPTIEIAETNRMPITLIAHDARRRLEAALLRGFTTVRDAGGADYGLDLAIRRGLVRGPRLFYCGHALSQTGGPRDDRNHFETGSEEAICPAHIGRVVDGPDQIRAAIRDEFRRGASFIKLMGSASAASSPVGSDQFADDEIAVALDEAARAAKYVTAHVHPDQSVRRLAMLGVPCLEHATSISAETAKILADKGTHVVPTLALSHALARFGAELGFAAAERMVTVAEESRTSLVRLQEAGVVTGFGTDILGPVDHLQTSEIAIRADLVPAAAVLRSATSVNARIMGVGDRLGRVAPSYAADLLIVDGDPLARPTLLDSAVGAALAGVMLDGAWVKRDGL